MPTTKTSKAKRTKGGKGKKDGKHELKANAEQEVKTPRVDAVIWEMRLKTANQDLAECQKAQFELARANDYLSKQLHRAEEDVSDAARHWRRDASSKDKKISVLEDKLQKQAALALEEKNKLVSEMNLIQDEVKTMREREAVMELELNEIREIKEIADQEHRENLIKTENKLFEETRHLERETVEQYNLQIELLKREHCELLVELERALQMQLDSRNENLKQAMKKKNDMEKLALSAARENVSLARQKDLLDSKVKSKAAEMKDKQKKVSKLVAKVASLEKALEQEDMKIEKMVKKEMINAAAIEASQVEVDKMQKVVAEQETEMQRVKQLAGNIVKKHKEMEKFFHEALDHVRQEITARRLKCKKDALQSYQRRFRKATAGKMKFPPICTFHESPHSTNSVYLDMEAAAKWSHAPGSEVHLSDLTWEQKEHVLQLVFATMNDEGERRLHQDVALCICSKREELCPASISHQLPESILSSTPNI